MPTSSGSHQQFEGCIGGFEVVAGVFQLLEGLDDLTQGVAVQLDAQLGGLQLDGGPTRHLRDQKTGAVAHQLRIHVLVSVTTAGDGTGVQPCFMGEGRGPHVGLLGVGGEVDQFSHMMGHGSEFSETTLRQSLHPHLQGQVGDDRHEVAVTDPLAIAVDSALHVGCTRGDSSQGVGHTTTSVIVEVHANSTVHSGHHVTHHGLDPAGKRPTVRVAQH